MDVGCVVLLHLVTHDCLVASPTLGCDPLFVGGWVAPTFVATDLLELLFVDGFAVALFILTQGRVVGPTVVATDLLELLFVDGFAVALFILTQGRVVGRMGKHLLLCSGCDRGCMMTCWEMAGRGRKSRHTPGAFPAGFLAPSVVAAGGVVGMAAPDLILS